MYSQDSAEKGPPRRAWQIHLSLSHLGRAAQPLLSREPPAGGVRPAGCARHRKGSPAPNRDFFLLSNQGMGFVHGEGS